MCIPCCSPCIPSSRLPVGGRISDVKASAKAARSTLACLTNSRCCTVGTAAAGAPWADDQQTQHMLASVAAFESLFAWLRRSAVAVATTVVQLDIDCCCPCCAAAACISAAQQVSAAMVRPTAVRRSLLHRGQYLVSSVCRSSAVSYCSWPTVETEQELRGPHFLANMDYSRQEQYAWDMVSRANATSPDGHP